MKTILKLVSLIVLSGFTELSSAQVIINGNNANKRYTHGSSGPGNTISISYTSILWVDGKNIPLPGHSTTFEDSEFFTGFGVEKWNVSTGVQVAYDKRITDRFLFNMAFTTARMFTGTYFRADLDATEKSRLSQLGIYASWSLTRNMDHRLQFQWLGGPEVIYARKRVTVQDYVTEDNPLPETYYQKLDVTEVSAVTGLGISFRVFGTFNLYANSLGGIAFPGKGMKITNSGLGLKVGF